jgi:hypothetical protein
MRLDASGSPDLPRTLPEALREFARHPSPRILAALAVGFAGARLAVGGIAAWDLVAAGAVALLWPIQEWLIHVLVLHFEPRRVAGRTLDFLVPQMHRAHHRDPWRLELVFIPLPVYLGVPAILAILIGSLLPSLPRVLSVLAVYFALARRCGWGQFVVHSRYAAGGARLGRVWGGRRLGRFG